jgi:shikimate dehydrogenase
MIPISGRTRLAAVIGSPVTHTLSPALHNAAFAAGGLDWVYVAFDVAPGDAPEALRAMRTLGIGGLSVTMPHKRDVADAVDELDPAAAALHSVNTVQLLPGGRTKGYSTDGDGFVAALRELGHSPTGMRVVVLGAGAAARSVIDALGRAEAGSIAVLNRTAATAREAVQLAPMARLGTDVDLAGADLIVNATSVGMADVGGDVDATPFDVSVLRPRHVVADLVYYPLDTALVRAARHAGSRVVDGLGMLVHQAALQQVIWTGERPDPAVLRRAAEAELAARS